MMERLVAVLLAGILVAPQLGQANESGLKEDWTGQPASNFHERLPLPPIPYLDTMPWITLETQSKLRGIDTLMQPELDFTGRNSALARRFSTLEPSNETSKNETSNT